MRKLVPLVLLVCIVGCIVSASAQTARLQAREAEWKNYAVPQTNFARQINPDKDFVFRVPAGWQQEGTDLTFKGPHSSILKVFVHKVPDGYPLQDFFASLLQEIKDTPGAESTLTRKTQLQDLEAREVFLEAASPDGEVFRSTSWVTVKGPLAVMFNLQVAATHAAEIEPFFKAVVQSVIFVSQDYPAFEALRSSVIKNPTAGPIYELESVVASLNEVNPDRVAAITRLTSLFASHADTAIDLLQDRRPFVRGAAVQAVARTNNSTLTPFLWEMVDDDEPFIAEAAARVVANAPDVIAKTLKHSQNGQHTATIARIWNFMPRDKRIELLQKIFNETAIPKTSPPPSAKPGVKVTVTSMEPVPPGKPVPDISIGVSNDPNVQIGVLTLLSTVPVDDFKLPLARIMAANYDPLIVVALQVGHLRGESLPLDPLIKLVGSSDPQVSKLAAQSLGLSANVSDIPRVEALISKDSAGAKKALDDELKLSVKKIRFRYELREAKSINESRAIVSKALSDPLLADFAWRYDCESTIAGCSPSSTQSPFKNDFTVKPYAENLFPKNVRHYSAITNPGQAVQKLYESLHGLQLDSPRAQSNLLLTMGYIRQNLARALSAPVDAATLIEYTGIDPNSPIAMASWTSERALDTTSLAQRKAIVLRVKDRGRFERAVEQFQRENGNFFNLNDYVAYGTRAIAALPAFLPLVAQAVLSTDPKKPNTTPILSYAFIGDKEWNGLRVKTVEHYWINRSWVWEGAATHMVFLGDTVLLTPDIATMRDLLSKVNAPGDRQHLADNPEFGKAIASRGDVVYFSDVKSVLAQFAEEIKAKPGDYNIKESGALNLGNATWENSHHLVFDESDWAKSLVPFHPKELSAPRELLPATTIAYYLMKVDPVSFWSSKSSATLIGEDLEAVSKLWALDFKKDVLSELGPECGAVLLELPRIDQSKESPTWATFCKLKSNKLVEALNAGKLFSGVGPTKDVAELKTGETSYFVTTRNGFMVIANREKAFAAFDGKSNLASTRDYSRAVEKVPSGIVAFGGYNLEAAIAAAGKPSADGAQAQVANIIFSVASAFHSQNFYATVTSGTVEARSSVAMDREGRYAVADLTFLPRATNITFVTIEPSGVPITDQKRLSNLVVKVRAKAAGPIDNIKDDIKTADQTVEQKSARELLLTIAARRGGGERAIELPVKDPQFAEYLKATPEFSVDDQQVKDQARQIAGEDRDAWSVAQKLADWTYKNLEWKSVQYASAAQTLATREADCSEFSALFVAMARSLGLPSRTVKGL
ncbi:MAG TPA: transglutaminase domain-containing protein, partial [Pyrinomonadaceae bacterium]|nr:transglutaminase domain-containing protein [Pyrinomonadaceae bacterium]